MPVKPSKITMENVKIGFRNFAGAESQYNKAGSRNFCVFLDPDVADQLSADGWNVRVPNKRDNNDERELRPYLSVEVSYKNYPPKIMVVTNLEEKEMFELTEDDVEMLDWAEIENVDLIIRPYNWEIVNKSGRSSGIKAYLQTMYVTIVEDTLSKKYGRQASR